MANGNIVKERNKPIKINRGKTGNQFQEWEKVALLPSVGKFATVSEGIKTYNLYQARESMGNASNSSYNWFWVQFRFREDQNFALYR